MKYDKSKTIGKFNYISIGIGIVLAITIIAMIAFMKPEEPENPISEVKQVSSMWQADSTMFVDKTKLDNISNANMENKDTEEQEEQEEQHEEEQQEEQQDERQKENDASDNTEETDLEDSIAQLETIEGNSASSEDKNREEGQNSDKDNGSGDGELGDSGKGEISSPDDNGEKIEEYFRTSIISGDILDQKEYSFTIKHLKPDLKVLGIAVDTNGREKTYSGKTDRFETELSEGENKIVVEVLYESGKDTVTASKGYTVYYAKAGKIIIITDLQNGVTDKTELEFSAYGLKGKERIDARVKVNNKKINGQDELFKTKLEPGNNIITITAGGRKDSVTEKFIVEQKDNIFKITTTLSPKAIYGTEKQERPEEVVYTSDKPEARFKVHMNKVTGKEKLKDVRVFKYDGSNSKRLTKDAEGYYSFEFAKRKSALVSIIYCDSEGEEKRYEYYVIYKRTDNTTPPEKYPSFKAQVEVGPTTMNLKSGMKFKSPAIILNITGKSCDNEPLYYNNYTVKLNGHKITHSYQPNMEWYGYDITLHEGENNLSIQVTDNDQYSITKNYKLYYTPGDITMTISVEASTVGLGYLIPPTKVTVEGGTNVAKVVTDLLEANGYTYAAGGSIEGGFYLQRIYKPGLCQGYKIPDDLIEMIEKDGGAIAEYFGPPDPLDSLGEFDFYRFAGWMYSYNGVFPGYGLDKCRPQDGAVIRLRFTLAMGKDIGGFTASGGLYEGNIQGNYGKEW